MLSAHSKQKMLAVSGLLSGAIIWGLIWYPYRLLAEAGISGALSSLLTYIVALLLGAVFYRHSFGALRQAGWLALLIGLTAGWTNLAYVIAILDGQVMRVLLLFYLSPLWTVLFSRLILGEKPSLTGYGVILLSLSGAIVMLWQPEIGLPVPQNHAEWMGLSAGLMFALSNVLARKAENLVIEVKSLSIWLGVAILSCLPLFWSPEQLAPVLDMTTQHWLILLGIGITLFVITLTVQFGLSHTPANQAIVIFLFELVVAAISSYWLASETMNMQEWLGGAMIVIASFYSGIIEKNQNDK